MKQMEVSGGNAESHEDDKNKVETILAKISFIKHTIAEKLGLSGKELNQATDETLVDAAADAIARADEDSGRTENTPNLPPQLMASYFLCSLREDFFSLWAQYLRTSL